MNLQSQKCSSSPPVVLLRPLLGTGVQLGGRQATDLGRSERSWRVVRVAVAGSAWWWLQCTLVRCVWRAPTSTDTWSSPQRPSWQQAEGLRPSEPPASKATRRPRRSQSGEKISAPAHLVSGRLGLQCPTTAPLGETCCARAGVGGGPLGRLLPGGLWWPRPSRCRANNPSSLLGSLGRGVIAETP